MQKGGSKAIQSYLAQHPFYVHQTDKNGKQTLDICRDCDLLPINGLSYENKEFTDGYTYREGTRWLSTVDYCMVHGVSKCIVISGEF